ncbi:hypothetical protein FHG66_03425 [Rubellimicrobium rubrum]|uniref:NnrU domain-containing protein n=1 Tax=Rubellimicrobium rubrum TaxID=2585369 RepID=A0A5C4N161_9RHOB|nr:NnrU family protein [Rubellimicrobium rubrum]TNC51875.1 hypothetical protein FHG66_03425 [Rubellimicrobium rubrum]
MIQLPLGLLAFSVPHLWKRLFPGSRLRWGDPGKGVVALLSIAGIWLAARGYGAWDDAPQIWNPAPWTRHLNNLLVVLGFYFFVASGMGVWGARVNRHPQLTGVILWAVAHLLVNGDAASMVLFGGFLVWAMAEIVLINRAVPLWVPPPRPPVGKEITAVVLALVLVAVVGYIHGWIGPWPFGA